MERSHIDTALDNGGKIHAFRSGGGLRVFRLEVDETLKGYGEHPDALIAIQHLEEDLAADNRAYEEVYGKLHPHYLTGSSSPSCDLDDWLLQGHDIDTEKQDDKILVIATGIKMVTPPEEALVAAKVTPGMSVEWTRTDETTGHVYKYQTVYDPISDGHRTKCIESPEDGDVWFENVKKEATGPTFRDAINQIFPIPDGIDIYGIPLE